MTRSAAQNIPTIVIMLDVDGEFRSVLTDLPKARCVLRRPDKNVLLSTSAEINTTKALVVIERLEERKLYNEEEPEDETSKELTFVNGLPEPDRTAALVIESDRDAFTAMRENSLILFDVKEAADSAEDDDLIFEIGDLFAEADDEDTKRFLGDAEERGIYVKAQSTVSGSDDAEISDFCMLGDFKALWGLSMDIAVSFPALAISIRKYLSNLRQ